MVEYFEIKVYYNTHTHTILIILLLFSVNKSSVQHRRQGQHAKMAENKKKRMKNGKTVSTVANNHFVSSELKHPHFKG